MPSMVVVSEQGSEFDLRDRLDGSGFRSYLPLTREMKIHRGRKVWGETPVFGRYVFVDQHVEWKRLFSLRGVQGIFMDAEKIQPALVRDKEMKRIRDSERNGYVIIDRKSRSLQKGQPVRVGFGPMSGFKGVFDGTRRGREAALLDILSGKVRVEFAPGVLAAQGE